MAEKEDELKARAEREERARMRQEEKAAKELAKEQKR
jgi:hypothetical protein